MTASSDIITDVREEALGVPIQCVTVRTPDQLKKSAGSKDKQEDDAEAADSTAVPEYKPDKDGFVPVVFVVEDGVAKAKQVKTGIQSDTHIEIIDGIAEGDQIVTGSYRMISQTLGNGTPVTVEDNKSEQS